MTKQQLYQGLARQLRSLLDGEADLIANAANCAALVFHTLPDLNWAGFYFHKDGELVLGPFQGQTACVRIALGKGVCGTAAQSGRTQVVDDVHEFCGHIACDAASRSEIVVPLRSGATIIGVLDVDSPRVGRFDEDDREGLEALARIFLEATYPDASAGDRRKEGSSDASP